MEQQKQVTTLFHCAGVISEEQLNVSNETETTITLLDGETEWVFDKKSGRCLNDNTSFGAKRTIKPFINNQ